MYFGTHTEESFENYGPGSEDVALIVASIFGVGLGIRRDFWEALALHFYVYTWLVLLYSCVLLIAVTEK